MIQGIAEAGDERGTEPGKRSADAAAEASFEGHLTLHLRASVPEAARARQRAVLDRLRDLERTGAVEELSVTEWPDRVRLASTPSSETAARTYEELLGAVGEDALAPFFQERPAVGPGDRALVFPVICVTARRDGELVGVFPRWKDGEHHAVGDCLRAIASGDCIENAIGGA